MLTLVRAIGINCSGVVDLGVDLDASWFVLLVSAGVAHE